MATPNSISINQRSVLPTERPAWFRPMPEDGWLTLLLLCVVVLITVASIQSVTWVAGLDLGILTFTAGIGLILGYITVQQGRIPIALVDLAAITLGSLIAFQTTANTVFNGNDHTLWSHTVTWFNVAIIQHASSNDNSVFLLFLALLCVILAYISVWLVIRARRPWLAALANGVILLTSLNLADISKTFFFMVLFLLATLLLLVRFTLAENTRSWRARGLRFSPDLGWDFMQAGAIFAVIVLLLAYILPVANTNASISAYWNSINNPWTQFEQRWQEIFSGVSSGSLGGSGAGGGFFASDLRLVGSVNLPNVVIMRYTVPNANNDPSQYLVTETLDTYDGQDQWTASPSNQLSYSPGSIQSSSTSFNQIDTYSITLDRSPGGVHLFAPGEEAAGFNVPSKASIGKANLSTQWIGVTTQNAGARYVAQGYVSTATAQQLQSVPYPAHMSATERSASFPDPVLQEYLYNTNVKDISPAVTAAAAKYTSGATNMYDAATALENYLRTFHYSTHNPDPPAGQDAIAWFLQTQTGFCTFFASAMAIMGRSLGMPTRIAMGFTGGTYDSQTHSYVVKGTQAHVWPQIYFGQYGWINFEPTASFDKFQRAQLSGSNITNPLPGSTASAGASPTPGSLRNKLGSLDARSPTSAANQQTTALVDVGLSISLIIALLLLCGILFFMWWRRLFRGLTPVTATFARIALLGRWAGAPTRRSQTPHEYAQALARVIPGQGVTLQRISDIYVRERYGNGAEEAHELPRLYDQVRVSISTVIVRRLRSAPLAALTSLRSIMRRGRSRPEN